jgi:hypothetical protein
MAIADRDLWLLMEKAHPQIRPRLAHVHSGRWLSTGEETLSTAAEGTVRERRIRDLRWNAHARLSWVDWSHSRCPHWPSRVWRSSLGRPLTDDNLASFGLFRGSPQQVFCVRPIEQSRRILWDSAEDNFSFHVSGRACYCHPSTADFLGKHNSDLHRYDPTIRSLCLHRTNCIFQTSYGNRLMPRNFGLELTQNEFVSPATTGKAMRPQRGGLTVHPSEVRGSQHRDGRHRIIPYRSIFRIHNVADRIGRPLGMAVDSVSPIRRGFE